MNFILLDKDEIKELENKTMRVENYFNNMKHNTYKKCWHYMTGIQSWHDTHNLSVNDSQKKLNDKLSELLLNKPSYYVTYECRNALWGFYWNTNKEHTEDNKFLIYHDKRGLSIQLHPKFRKDMVEQLLNELFNTLVNKDNISEGLTKVLKDIL